MLRRLLTRISVMRERRFRRVGTCCAGSMIFDGCPTSHWRIVVLCRCENNAWFQKDVPIFDFKDESVVIVIGSGAGGGTLAHELTRRGIKVVLLEAGKRQSLETFSQVPGEAFTQLTWLDARTQSGTWGVARDFPTLPVWHCKNGGRYDCSLDSILPAAASVGTACKDNVW